MDHDPVTVEQVREVQELFKAGYKFHQEQKYKEAIAEFKKAASVRPIEEGHLKELATRLKGMSVKLVQESIAYMGCATMHFKMMVDELDEDQRDAVPLDETLKEQFEKWDSE
ncbi:hypothetical protein [Nitrospina watsonii]|uniref:TPR_REGION domain-containing protein n=1 Tax=Nitrospina watsonii TaxID=1323948 RepID=A0ABN8VWM4_9BACT|nr:hypothetical protein [Nitrospina watsonii]CAI2718083.1 TPR_REGION domain-containing protein [Nitrospina watsonii]